MEALGPDRIRELFSQHGIRCTRQREEVYAALRRSDGHPTADDLYQQVRLAYPGISLATVYNTLAALTERGLCRRLGGGVSAGAPCRYDGDLADHAHLVMPDGEVRDIPEHLALALLRSFPEDMVRRIGDELGVRVERVSVEVHAARPAGPAHAASAAT